MAKSKPPPLREDNGCCGCVGRVMCAIILAPSLVAIIALAVASMSGGRNSNWMKYQQMEPPYTLQAGYDGFMVYGQFGLTEAAKLRKIWLPLWILGIVSVGLLGLSVLLAILLFLVTMAGAASHWFTILTIPMGLAQLAAVVGYVVVAIFQIRNYTALTVGAEAFYTPVPDWGWVCAFVVAMLWLWCTAWLGVMPRKPRHYEDEELAPLPQSPAYPGTPPQQQQRTWYGGKARAPIQVVHAPTSTPATPVVKVVPPGDAHPPPPPDTKKKGLLGFGIAGKKKKEPEAPHEEYRARPFTETSSDGATQGAQLQQAGPPNVAPQPETIPTPLGDPQYESSAGAWAAPSGQQPAWVGAPEPDLKPKSRGLLGVFKKK